MANQHFNRLRNDPMYFTPRTDMIGAAKTELAVIALALDMLIPEVTDRTQRQRLELIAARATRAHTTLRDLLKYRGHGF